MDRACSTNAVSEKCVQNFVHKNTKRKDLMDISMSSRFACLYERNTLQATASARAQLWKTRRIYLGYNTVICEWYCDILPILFKNVEAPCDIYRPVKVWVFFFFNNSKWRNVNTNYDYFSQGPFLGQATWNGKACGRDKSHVDNQNTVCL
jgi:hypothetical protein